MIVVDNGQLSLTPTTAPTLTPILSLTPTLTLNLTLTLTLTLTHPVSCPLTLTSAGRERVSCTAAPVGCALPPLRPSHRPLRRLLLTSYLLTYLLTTHYLATATQLIAHFLPTSVPYRCG